MAEGDSDRQNSLQAGPGHERAVPRGPEDREGPCQCWGRGEVPRPTPGRARDISTTVTCGPDASQRPQRRFSKWGSCTRESLLGDARPQAPEDRERGRPPAD